MLTLVSVKHGRKLFRISKPRDEPLDRGDVLPPSLDEYCDTSGEEDEDLEALKPPSLRGIYIDYDIILSPIYQVPVLYFDVRDAAIPQRFSLEQVYNLVVPESMKAQLENTGIIGGISMINHPCTDMPVYFIHPCRTADAMRKLTTDSSVQLHDYMLLWLGLVGSTVGLCAPLPDLEKT